MSEPLTPAKAAPRAELAQRYAALWGGAAPLDRPPDFPGAGKAAERLRRLPQYRAARVVAVMADPVLLQARINTLGDGKTLLAATPGLKQGLVRLTPQALPLPRRSIELRGHAMAQAGQVLRLPQARVGKVDMLVAPALAVGDDGLILGDGRGLLDLTWALLLRLGAIQPSTPVVVLAAEEMLLPLPPAQPWDLGADLALTPERCITFAAPIRPAGGMEGLNERLAGLPLVKAVLGMRVKKREGDRRAD